MSQSFGREEKLKSRKRIEELFADGQSIKAFPLIAIFKKSEGPVNQAGFTVSKKRQKRAVDRNLIKRRMRESYRLNKALLESPDFFDIMFIYVGKGLMEYQTIAAAMVKLLEELKKTNSQQS